MKGSGGYVKGKLLCVQTRYCLTLINSFHGEDIDIHALAVDCVHGWAFGFGEAIDLEQSLTV